MNILEKICENKKIEIEYDKKKYPLNKLDKLIEIHPNRGFMNLLTYKKNNKQNNIIGEIKKSSPSAGNIVKDYKPELIAKIYENSGIGAISVLTEKKYFEGDIQHINLINQTVNIPILRKDFIIDPYQVVQSKFYNADAILIILSIVSFNQALELIETAKEYNIDCLVEIHEKNEIDKALKLNNLIIGINNRNLKNLETNLDIVKILSNEIPHKYTIVAESGIKTRNDINLYNEIGIYNFLIGETILKSYNIKKKIEELI